MKIRISRIFNLSWQPRLSDASSLFQSTNQPTSETMSVRSKGGLTEEELDELLNQSDIEDNEDVDILNDELSQSDIEYDDMDNDFRPSDSTNESSEDGVSDEENIIPAPRVRGVRRGRGRVRTRGGVQRGTSRLRNIGPSWSEKKFSKPQPHLTQPAYLPSNFEANDDLEYFSQYIDDKFIDLIVEKTNQSTLERTGKIINFTNRECQVYIGISMIMSCINYPIVRMYWEKKWVVPIVAQSMPRDRYFLIRNSLKLVFDNDISQEQRAQDKLWKVRPIIDRILEECFKLERNQHISIDEMIIPFTGVCGIKQFCPRKPNPEGLKVFVLANSNGLVCDMVVYQGKTTFPEETNAGFYLGESAILNLCKTLVPGHIIYCDRYFTTVKLAEELLKKNITLVGTIMKNKIPKNVRSELESDTALKRRGRGSFQVLVRDDDKIAITKWFDNKPVFMLSTLYGGDPTDTCKRWIKTSHQYEHITRPSVIRCYNEKMGGVDMAGRLLSVCPSRTRTKKWTIRFIAHMIDIAVTNSWIKYKENKIKKNVARKHILQLRNYKIYVAESLIERGTYVQLSTNNPDELLTPTNDRKRGRPASVPVPSKIRRTEGALHLPEYEPEIQKRCRNVGCQKKTVVKCISCNVFLCFTSQRNCFKEFHTK